MKDLASFFVLQEIAAFPVSNKKDFPRACFDKLFILSSL
jgi:hypothetical protein